MKRSLLAALLLLVLTAPAVQGQAKLMPPPDATFANGARAEPLPARLLIPNTPGLPPGPPSEGRENAQAGFRLNAGYWLDPLQRVGFEAGGFWLGNNNTAASAAGSARFTFDGWDVAVRQNACCCCNGRIDALLGYRQLRLAGQVDT